MSRKDAAAVRTISKPLSAVTLAGALLLTACSSGDSDSEAGASSSSSGSGFPVTIADHFGTTTIEQAPERVAAVSWGNADTLLALGTVPVGMPKTTYGDEDGDGYLPWTLDKINALGGSASDITLFDEATATDFEGVADSTPDLVFAASSGLSDDDDKTLKEIAPTVAYPDTAWTTPWRTSLQMAGQALGKQDQAAQVQSDLEKQISDAVAAGNWQGKTFAVAYLSSTDLSSLSIYTAADPRTQFMTDLGLVEPDSIKKLTTDAGDAFYTQLSAENADVLDDVDMLVAYGTEDDLKTAQADPLLGKIPAIENGAVALVDTLSSGAGSTVAASLTPTPLAIPYALQNLAPQLTSAASKVQ